MQFSIEKVCVRNSEEHLETSEHTNAMYNYLKEMMRTQSDYSNHFNIRFFLHRSTRNLNLLILSNKNNLLYISHI